MGINAASSISVQGLRKHFGGVAALDDVSLELETGATLALVGESGSGKTTLLRTINRLVEPDAGRIFVGGVDAASLDPVLLRRRIGYVPQDGGLLPHWRVQRNVELTARLNGASDPESAHGAVEALRLVGLDPSRFAARWPHELSGGQRQRVALARALAASPTVVLLDEPFGALDAITRAELQDTFLAVRAARQMTSVVVTHDVHEALLLGSVVAVLRAGRIEQFATPDALVQSPATAYVDTLLKRSRVIDARGTR